MSGCWAGGLVQKLDELAPPGGVAWGGGAARNRTDGETLKKRGKFSQKVKLINHKQEICLRKHGFV